MKKTEPPVSNPAVEEIRRSASLSERESELLRRSGERIFALSRKAAAAEREGERLRGELEQTNVLLAEVRRSRDVLTSQVESLMAERERDYQERAELRRLLVNVQQQAHALLTAMLQRGNAAPPQSNLIGRPAPQRAGHIRMVRASSNGAADGR